MIVMRIALAAGGAIAFALLPDFLPLRNTSAIVASR